MTSDSSVICLFGKKFHTCGSLVLFTGLFLACWLPYLIICYPGIITYDEVWSILQMAGSGSMPLTAGGEFFVGHFAVDHKPILHTFILGAFFHFGNAIGSQNLGLFILLILQAAFVACGAASITVFLKKYTSRTIFIIAAVFFCLFPGIPLCLISPSNDSLYAGFFMIWMVCIALIVLTKGNWLHKNRRNIAVFILSSIGIVLFKKPGIFIVLLTLLALLCFYRMRGSRKIILAGLSSAVLASLLITLFIYPVYDVIPGGKQESLGPIFQQTAAYVTLHESEITEEERMKIDAVLDYNALPQVYDPLTHDPAKRCFRQESTTGDLLSYVTVWASQGFKHPETYFNSGKEIWKGYFLPFSRIEYFSNNDIGNTSFFVDLITDHNKEYPEVIDVSQNIHLGSPDWALKAQDLLRKFTTIVSDSPLGVFMILALYATWIPLSSFIVSLFKRRHLAWIFIPILLSVFVVIISPVVYWRYVFPLACVAPLLIGIATIPKTKSR